MNIEKERLLALVEFVEQSTRVRIKVAPTVASHGQFSLHEHELQGLPGIRLNHSLDGDDEVWLTVERLHETQPPQARSAVLAPWLQLPPTPTEEPTLRDSVQGASLISAGTHCSSLGRQAPSKVPIAPDAVVRLSDYANAAQVRAQFTTYVETHWKAWAGPEVVRRKAIRLYARLFTLMQQLEGNIVESQLELLWGVGLGVWQAPEATVSYPLVGRRVEISVNGKTAEIEIRPRDVEPRLEVDWYASVDSPGVPVLEKRAREFFASSATTFSPFDRGTFEPLLRLAATNLDANGIYWPDQVPPTDRTVPTADARLKVTDTWVLFARPRTNSPLLQDLARLKAQVDEATALPGAVNAIVTDPDTSNPVVELPVFRGMSAAYHAGGGEGAKARDLYFPKPFNDEQVRIVQLLDVFDGVVVQGPPGTGKTHTIANVICHYLAQGKRVLVTSMKDPALAVLQEQLPDEIRPLAIPLLATEQEGMKKFEHAIHKIASEVQSLDRVATARRIRHLEESIDALHGRLARIDGTIAEWAKRNLTRITLDGEEIDPQDAAREVVAGVGQIEWLTDSIEPGVHHSPQFSDGDIVMLREARRSLGADIDYLGASLPQLVELPDSRSVLDAHKALSQFETLKAGVEKGEVPALADSRQETLEVAQQLLGEIDSLRQLRRELAESRRPWAGALRNLLHRAEKQEVVLLLDALGVDLEQAMTARRVFLARPVSVPGDADLDLEFGAAVRNLAEGRRAFGVAGLFGKSEARKRIAAVRIVGHEPASPDDWKYVARYVAFLKRLRDLTVRWNALAAELPLQPVPERKPEGGIAAAEAYRLHLKVKAVVDAERRVRALGTELFPTWAQLADVANDEERLSQLEQTLRHHLTKNRLATVWSQKERFQAALQGRRGRVVDGLQRFLARDLGNPTLPDDQFQEKWSELSAEVSRVLGLQAHLTVVQEVSSRISASGALKWAQALREPVGTTDTLLPDNWRQVWRLRRLSTHLDNLDARSDLKRLARERRDAEGDLARAYRDVVVGRTWLRLAENASDHVRAALQAYLAAIMRIRGGTGPRAARYRMDARMAASQANAAVPCWIMAHYRVSETLPAELGCFDLVVIDEASQSDLTALPALLRAKKMLIVGDDKQVSPEAVGLAEQKVLALMERFLGRQVPTYRPQMSPERSIYDLFKVVFATSSVMLKEHFRCVAPIVEYSKREFYNHELRPLRIPRASERLDPPLIDVFVEDGYRKADTTNPAEGRFILEEIKTIVGDSTMAGRSIGVVSLLADKQSSAIWERLTAELGPEVMRRHRITCGDARTFQGKERDIMFLSMVSAPNEVGAPLSRDTFAQRFNVAASRAKDRMYLVRSLSVEDLPESDKLRRSLILHFVNPFGQDEERVADLRGLCESPFEREMYDELAKRGYRVTPQVRVGQYRIDLVVEGHNDTRLAVECDGDRYHGADKWLDDMQRERVLERAGWSFWRCFASTFVRHRSDTVDDLLRTLTERGVEPIGGDGAPRSVHVERRVVCALGERSARADSPASVETEAVTAGALVPEVDATTPIPMPATAPHVEHVERAMPPDQPLPQAEVPAGLADPQRIPTASLPDGERQPAPRPLRRRGDSSVDSAILASTGSAAICDRCGRANHVLMQQKRVYVHCGTSACPTPSPLGKETLERVLKQLDVRCDDPACGAPRRAVEWSYGSFVGCSRYPRCRKAVSWPDLKARLDGVR